MNDEGLHFRGYRPSDLDALYRLDQECFSEAFRFSRTTIGRIARAKDSVTVIAEQDGVIAGFCIAQTSEGTKRAEAPTAYLATIDVSEDFRGRGLARALLKRLEVALCNRKIRVLNLHVYRANAAAVSFYENTGFQQLGMQSSFYGAGLDALIYRKDLMCAQRADRTLG